MDTNADFYVFEFANVVESPSILQVTKRYIPKISAMLFDPLVVVYPIVLNANFSSKKYVNKNLNHGTFLYQLIQKNK